MSKKIEEEMQLSFDDWKNQMQGATAPKGAVPPPTQDAPRALRPRLKGKNFKFPASFFEHRKQVVDMPEEEKQKLKAEFEKTYKHPLVNANLPPAVFYDWKKKKKSELVVITCAKKLLSYIVAVTEKAPKKYRFTFVNRMQNYAIEIVEDLFKANNLRTDIKATLAQRKDLQKDAYNKLKMLSYLSYLAFENGVILQKQYFVVADNIHECLVWLHQWMWVNLG